MHLLKMFTIICSNKINFNVLSSPFMAAKTDWFTRRGEKREKEKRYSRVLIFLTKTFCSQQIRSCLGILLEHFILTPLLQAVSARAKASENMSFLNRILLILKNDHFQEQAKFKAKAGRITDFFEHMPFVNASYYFLKVKVFLTHNTCFIQHLALQWLSLDLDDLFLEV